MTHTGADLKPLRYYLAPGDTAAEAIARAQSKWLEPYHDRALYPQEGDRMLATAMRRAQYEIYRNPARFRVVGSGRRFGKTQLLCHEMLRATQTGFRREVAYLAPSLKDAKRLVWLDLKRMIPRDMMDEESKNEQSMTLMIRGYESRIRLFGADRPESIYGEGFDFLVIDEAQSIPEIVWNQYARPTLVDKQGEAIIAFRPEGRNWCYDAVLFAENPDNADWAAFRYTTLDGENVAPEEVERERAGMSTPQFQQEYMASFETPSGLVYKEFERSLNVTAEAKDLGGAVLIGMDFNVNPFCFVMASKTDDGGLYVWAEREEKNFTTERAAALIKELHKDRTIIVYPDPNGRSRHTSGGTDFAILRSAGFQIIAPARTPPIKDRVNTLEAMFKDASGRRRLKIHPRCRRLIRCLEGLSYNDAGDKPDKKEGFDHFPDALGYLTWSLFPIVRYQTGMARLVG